MIDSSFPDYSSPFFTVQIASDLGSGAYTFVEAWAVTTDPSELAEKASSGRSGTVNNPGYAVTGATFAVGDYALCRSADGCAGAAWELYPVGAATTLYDTISAESSSAVVSTSWGPTGPGGVGILVASGTRYLVFGVVSGRLRASALAAGEGAYIQAAVCPQSTPGTYVSNAGVCQVVSVQSAGPIAYGTGSFTFVYTATATEFLNVYVKLFVTGAPTITTSEVGNYTAVGSTTAIGYLTLP